jgi:hypothetical protein
MAQNVTAKHGSVSTGVEIRLTKNTLDRVRFSGLLFKKILRVGNVLCQGCFVNLDGSDSNFFLYMGRQCKSQQDDSKEIFEL